MMTNFIHDVVPDAYDLLNYTKWFPIEHQHQIADVPALSMWDLHYAVYAAIIISLVRYVIVNPFYVWLAIRTVPLSHRSFRQVNDSRDATSSHYIPPWVVPLLGRFLDKQARIMKEAKKSGRSEAMVEGRMNSQKQWKEVEKDIAARLHLHLPVTPAFTSPIPAADQYSEDDIHRWLSAYHHDQQRSMKLKKFTEAGWQFSFYTFICVWGLVTISDKDYFTKSIHLVWANYPVEPPSLDVTWYYWLSMGHYIHLFCAAFFDVKRKDFAEMIIHHIVTLLLLSFSWMVNFTKIGALVLAVHDGCDVFLQLAKLFNYMHFRTLTNLTFAVFAITFFVCRLIIFPGRIIYTCLVWTVTTGGYKPWLAYFFFNSLLLSLQVLHIIWSTPKHIHIACAYPSSTLILVYGHSLLCLCHV